MEERAKSRELYRRRKYLVFGEPFVDLSAARREEQYCPAL